MRDWAGKGRRTEKPQGGQAAVVRPGAIWILPWAQCIRQCRSSVGSDLIHCSASVAAREHTTTTLMSGASRCLDKAPS